MMRYLKKLWQNIIFGAKSSIKNNDYNVEITETYIKIFCPDGNNQQIAFHEIENIKIKNTNAGPYLPDRWLVLSGKGKICAVPQGTDAWNKIYDLVSEFEGFDFENVFKSAGFTGNKTFDLWKR